MTAVIFTAGAGTLTLLSILIDHGRNNGQEIGKVTEIYHSAADAIAANMPSGGVVGGVPTVSAAPVVPVGDFGGGSSELSRQAAHRSANYAQGVSVEGQTSPASR